MAQTILLKNFKTDKVKLGIIGFSWVTLFFGGLVPLFRRDWKMFFILVLFFCGSIYILTSSIPYTMIQQYGFTSLYFETNGFVYNLISSIHTIVVNILGGFFYNKIYTQKLLKKGFKPMTQEDKNLLLKKGFTLFINSDDEFVE